MGAGGVQGSWRSSVNHNWQWERRQQRGIHNTGEGSTSRVCWQMRPCTRHFFFFCELNQLNFPQKHCVQSAGRGVEGDDDKNVFLAAQFTNSRRLFVFDVSRRSQIVSFQLFASCLFRSKSSTDVSWDLAGSNSQRLACPS